MADEKKAPGKATAKVLDFTNVKERSAYNPVQQEEGDYRAKIASVVSQESSKGADMWVFGIQLVDSVTAVYPYYCVLDEEQLWKLRNLIQATGKTVQKKRLKFDPNTIINQVIGISLIDDEYDGKMKSVIQNVFSADELDDGEDDEEEEPPAKKKVAGRAVKGSTTVGKKKTPPKKKAAPVEDDDDEDLDDEEDIDDDELDELDVDEL